MAAFIDRSDGALAFACVVAAALFLIFRSKDNEKPWQPAVALGLSLPLVLALFAVWAPLIYPGIGGIITVFLLHPNALVLLFLGVFVWWKFLRQGFQLQTSTTLALVIAGFAILGQIAGKFL